MGAKLGAVLTILVGWVLAIAIFLFLRTLETPIVAWGWAAVVILLLPRETYRVLRMLIGR